jgi:hypothetical protein
MNLIFIGPVFLPAVLSETAWKRSPFEVFRRTAAFVDGQPVHCDTLLPKSSCHDTFEKRPRRGIKNVYSPSTSNDINVNAIKILTGHDP